jgi:formylglycine-generating enzyme required for sulfatase activity
MKRITQFVTIMSAAAALAFVNFASAQGPGGTPSAEAVTAPTKPVETFKDCPDCPEMVVIPAGTFMMGSDPAEGEREGVARLTAREHPRHEVTIKYSFAIGRTDITRGFYAEFAEQDHSVETGKECGVPRAAPTGGGAGVPGAGAPGAAGPGAGSHSMYDEEPFDPNAPTKKNWRNPGFVQFDTEPAVCVSYNDAKKFVAWLSKKIGKHYRLPSDAEWEYAARGGTTTARYWGDDSKSICTNANVETFKYTQAAHDSAAQDALLCNSDNTYTRPVGSLTPNPFGLYDVLGNVAQAVDGCAHSDYNGAPTDGSAWWDDSNCKLRNWRGGSYSGQAWMARSAGKIQQSMNYRSSDFGLRVVRELDK